MMVSSPRLLRWHYSGYGLRGLGETLNGIEAETREVLTHFVPPRASLFQVGC